MEGAYKYFTEISLREVFGESELWFPCKSFFFVSRRAVEAGRVIHEKGLKPTFPVDVKATKGLHKTKREYLASQLKLMFLKLD